MPPNGRIRVRVNRWGFKLGVAPWFDIEAGGLRWKRGPIWIPDGLHIWIGRRGVHLYWSGKEVKDHVVFSRLTRDEWKDEVSLYA